MTRAQRVARLATSLFFLAVAACSRDLPTQAEHAGLAPRAAASGNGQGQGKGGGGGGDEGYGNNLSVPVIFAEGRGLAGVVIGEGPARYANTGLRPLATLDAAAAAELSANDALPFWYSGNTPSGTATPQVFWQKTANVWQAQWLARPAGASSPVVVDWGDNLASVRYSTTSVVRVEHVLTASDGTTLLGYPMDTTVNPSSPNEEQGIFADGAQTTTASFTPTVFTDRARLTIQKLDAKGGNVTFTFFDKAVFQSFGVDGPGGYSAEINVGGKVLFGYVWDLKKVVMPPGVSKDGWWRITFSLDNGSGATITGLAPGDELLATNTANSTVAEVELGTTRGGRKP